MRSLFWKGRWGKGISVTLIHVRHVEMRMLGISKKKKKKQPPGLPFSWDPDSVKGGALMKGH